MAEQALNVLKKFGKKGKYDKTKIHKIDFTRFPCGEMKPKIRKNVRRKEVFLFFDFNGLPNDDVVNLLLTIEALVLADAKRITLILPFMPYLRQDRKDEPRTPISAAWLIRALQQHRTVKRVITIDMHSDQLQSVFTIPTDHLPGRTIFVEWAKEYFKGDYSDLVAVAPDFGSAKRVRKLAKSINSKIPVTILEKDRDGQEVDMLSVIGAPVKGKVCLINDDMMDTCGTIILAANTLYAEGAKEVILSATHPIFSDKDGTSAYEKLAKAKVKVVVTDSLVTKPQPWLEVLPLGNLMGWTILRNLNGGSVSKLIRKGLPTI